MLEVFSHQDSTMLGYYKSVLEAEGIACFIRNEHGQTLGRGFLGFFQRLPFLDPVLCVADESQRAQALEVLARHRQPMPENDTDWLCPNCKEMVPSSFESCWNCETPKPVL